MSGGRGFCNAEPAAKVRSQRLDYCHGLLDAEAPACVLWMSARFCHSRTYKTRGKTLYRRWLIAVPIVTFWLVTMGHLVRSEVAVERLDSTDRSHGRVSSPRESWLGIFLTDGRRIGSVHLRQSPEARHGLDGVQMLLEARMLLQVLGKSTDLELSGAVWRSEESARAEFEFAARSAGFEIEMAGHVEDGELRGEMVSAGEVIPLRLPIDDEVVFAGGLGSVLRFPRLDVGDEYRLDIFDPLTLSKSEARVRCVARERLRVGGSETSTCRLTVTSSGLSSRAWVDDQGEVVRAETPIGLVLERSTPSADLVPAPIENRAEDLLEKTAIRPTGKRPFRSARKMKVRLSGFEGLALPEDRKQIALGDGRYQLETPDEPQLGLSLAPTPESSTSEHLASDAFVQSDHPKIRRQAVAITGRDQDPWRRSLKIHEWVFSRLDKEPVVSIPSALEVLEQRRGDCNEHTVLFTALARAASVPTRVAIGIVWSDELEGFFYHAWPEVHLGTVPGGRPGSGWYSMDPTLGQPLADATHIKLFNGGIETWPQLLPYLGKIEIEVLEVE